MSERHLYLNRHVALGEYYNIREIFVHTFELLVGRLSRTYDILDCKDIFVENPALIVMEYKHG